MQKINFYFLENFDFFSWGKICAIITYKFPLPSNQRATGCPRKKFLLGFAFKHNENDTKEFHLGHFSTALSVQI